MTAIEELAEEVGADYFRPLTRKRREAVKDSTFQTYDPDEDTTMTLDQAKRFSEAARRPVGGPPGMGDDEFFELWDRVLDDWPNAEVRFSGMLDEHGYLDGVYLCYDGVLNGPRGRQKADEFERYCVLHFKHWMDEDPADNKGICSCCNDQIETTDERFRQDDALWASPDEFNIRVYDTIGGVVRLWWD